MITLISTEKCRVNNLILKAIAKVHIDNDCPIDVLEIHVSENISTIIEQFIQTQPFVTTRSRDDETYFREPDGTLIKITEIEALLHNQIAIKYKRREASIDIFDESSFNSKEEF